MSHNLNTHVASVKFKNMQYDVDGKEYGRNSKETSIRNDLNKFEQKCIDFQLYSLIQGAGTEIPNHMQTCMEHA